MKARSVRASLVVQNASASGALNESGGEFETVSNLRLMCPGRPVPLEFAAKSALAWSAVEVRMAWKAASKQKLKSWSVSLLES